MRLEYQTKEAFRMKKLMLLLAAVLLLVTFGSAQDYGSIYGTVTDTEGNPLPGVSVSISSAYYPERTVVTSTAGTFRFLRLPVARDYKLKFELTGFKTVIRENIIVEFGKDYRLDVSMQPAPIEESVTVVAQTPVIDTKKAQVGIRVSKEMLMDLPTARNPWVIMQMAPGILVDREDVGGNEAGQQSSYYGHGSSSDDNTWMIDGANITDNSALGAAPSYVNLSSYEELVINYGVNDVTSPTGGIQLNLVSKRGGNNYAGEFYLDAAQKEWQLKNVPADLAARGYVSPGVNKLYLYGVNFGGPIIRDKLWFYGSWGVQDIDSLTMTAGITDKTWLLSGYGKLNFQLFKGNRAEFFLEYDNKLKWNRTFAGVEYQAPETMWNQTGPGYIYKFEDEQVIGNLLLTAKAIYTDGGFALNPVKWGSGKYEFESIDGYYSGNVDYYGTDRNQWDVVFNGNYFKERFLGGDHEIKFGAEYLTATVTTFDLYEGNASIHEYYTYPEDPTYYDVWLYRDYYINLSFKRYSAFLQDTITFGKLTLNLGVRYDWEKSIVKNEHQPEAPFLKYYLRDITIAKYDPGIAWKTLSPRFSLTYDLFGNGKNVFKIAAARYGSQSGFGLASFVNPAGWTEIDMLWKDLNGDGKIQETELFGYDWEAEAPIHDLSPDYWLWWTGFDPDDPSKLVSPNKYDPKYNTPLLDELTVSFQKELLPDFAASLEFFYKKRHRLTWDIPLKADGTKFTQNDYTVYTTYTFPITGEQRVLYRRPSRYGNYRTYSDKAYQRYLAGQIVLSKRLSNRWMMNASFTYDDWKFFYNGEFDWGNVNNMVFYDGGVVAPQSGGSGLTGIFVNSRWMAKLSGLYQLPYDINISGTFQVREGYVMPRYARVYVPGFGTTSLYSGKMGDNRLPAFWEMSLRLEKVFKVGETARVIVSADAFNVFNKAIALKKQNLLTASNYGQTVRILNPCVFRFGARYSF